MILTIMTCLLLCKISYPWGFFAHEKINYQAVFLLPPQMIIFYKQHIDFLKLHSVDPDKRRYAIQEEGARHFIDIDHFGAQAFDSIPEDYNKAIAKYTLDSLQKHGIVPWWIQIMQRRLVAAFRAKDAARILKLSAEIGHYLADAHVPLHACSNHNGQFTGQKGIHGFWESRLPELLADKEWDFFIGKAGYIKNTLGYIWKRVRESARASDTVLRLERELTSRFPTDGKYSFEERNGQVIRQYSFSFSLAYDRLLGGMVERRMRQSIFAVASYWYSAWVDAGQPDLNALSEIRFTAEELNEFEKLNKVWQATGGREHE